ncbi:gliding motility-associated C-terminal domain-containing protein [Sediminibacterium ginsengisoli]|uniref:Gliding motility-associated C-terminal domain-containing protein n=1 Tax=Sediminibacterium ginsengisoli TaxID=413434 RepID=A0A1T4NBA8_9BACT|nr:gliding motility-associated C-terminal domain-containing protein [Sediminibacterium ginsengisoli]SJZ76541.1 gliding motility-associated C-terminal domain-containing protein [Sediminibacterium ginsengisoli]
MKSLRILRRMLVIIIGIFLALKGIGQKIVLATDINTFVELDLSSGSCAILPLQNPCMNQTSGQIFSVALHKDTLYYSTTAGLLYSTVLNQPGTCKLLVNSGISNALTADKNGLLYWMRGTDLVQYDPHHGVLRTIGTVPYPSAGDLIFYNDKLYLASQGLVEININNPAASVVYMQTPNHDFFGLVSIPVSCSNNKIYGIEPDRFGTGSNLVEIDMDNKKVLNTLCSLPESIWDAASITESGLLQGIQVQNLAVQAQCGTVPGNVLVQAAVASNAGIAYTLNNITNATGYFNPLGPGQYSIHMRSADGCAADTTVQVKQFDALDLTMVTTKDTCASGNGTLKITPLKGSSPFSFSVQGQPATSSPDITGLPAGAYRLNVKDVNRCNLDTTFTIGAVSPPVPLDNIKILAASCTPTGGEVTLTYSSPAPGLLGASMDGGAVQATPVFGGLASGTHRLQIVTTSCRYDSIITIAVQPPVVPVISFTNTIPGCTGRNDGAFKMNVSNITSPFTVSVNNSAFSAATTYTGLAAGQYKVAVKDGTQCIWNVQHTLNDFVIIPPVISQQITPAECWRSQPGKAKLTVTGADAPYSYEVNGRNYPSGQESTLPAGNYQVIIRTARNCPVDTVPVVILQQNTTGAPCDTAYVPTAFTPNNDGKNDLLRPVVNGGIVSFIFRVYNRYGQPVFTTTTAGTGWDGRLNNLPQPAGTYVWYLECIDNQQRKREFKGSVVLIR